MPTPTERYHAAAHAMQSGVAMEISRSSAAESATSPKHLRVGINTAHTDHGSLAWLLVAKGVISEAEYLEALAAGMEAEKARYEALLSDRLGTKVTLA